eukprot:5374138-Alexandrium_andersonii.AAC.1
MCGWPDVQKQRANNHTCERGTQKSTPTDIGPAGEPLRRPETLWKGSPGKPGMGPTAGGAEGLRRAARRV